MKQSDIERISRIVVLPLSAIYGPYNQEVVDMMLGDLAGYDSKTLEAAVVLVRQRRQTRPTIAHIIEACNEVTGPRRDSSPAEAFLAGLRKRDSDAVAMTARFLEGYMTSELFKRALAGGWDRELAEYAYNAAQLQARYITNAPNPGYSLFPLTNCRNLPRPETDRRIRAFILTCRTQARTGIIEVTVPSDLIDEWVHDASRAAELKAALQPKPQITVDGLLHAPGNVTVPPKSELEMEIDRQIAAKA